MQSRFVDATADSQVNSFLRRFFVVVVVVVVVIIIIVVVVFCCFLLFFLFSFFCLFISFCTCENNTARNEEQRWSIEMDGGNFLSHCYFNTPILKIRLNGSRNRCSIKRGQKRPTSGRKGDNTVVVWLVVLLQQAFHTLRFESVVTLALAC
jgi:hypothetical protein